MSEIQSSNFSETAASNNAATPNGWPEGQAPSTVNDCARELMAAIKRDWNRSRVTTASTGSDPAYVVTYTNAPTLTNGMIYAFKSNFANLGAATLNINSLGALAIRKGDGTTALAANDILSGQHVLVSYDSTDNFFRLLTPPGTAIAAASATASGIIELATDAEVQTGTDTVRAVTPAGLTAKEGIAGSWFANTANRLLTTDIVWGDAAEVTLTDAATIAVDFATFINAVVTLGGNRAMGNPTNEKVGQSGYIRIVQDGTGTRTLSYGTDWEFAGGVAPVLSTPAASQDLLFYQIVATNRIFASLVKAIA